MNYQELNRNIGNIDIYLLDQLLKGKLQPEMKILDAGCGEGRNLFYLINSGYEVYGVDENALAIKMLKMSAKDYTIDRFVHSTIEEMIFPPKVFDYIICSAVLHFAKDHNHFDKMVTKLLSVLRPGGTLFIRMHTDVAEKRPISDQGQVQLSEGSNRYVFQMKNMDQFLLRYNLKLIEPPKSVVVHNERSMGIFILEKLDTLD